MKIINKKFEAKFKILFLFKMDATNNFCVLIIQTHYFLQVAVLLV